MKTTDPHTFIELLEVFSIALTNGCLNKSDVVKWADSIIMLDDEPDNLIIELSLCGQKSINDVVSLLNEFIGENKQAVSARVILGLLYNQYLKSEITFREIVGTVDWLTLHSSLTEEEKNFMYGLEDTYSCAEDGIYGRVDNIEIEALRFLKIYQDFNLNNFNDWNKINLTIADKISVLAETKKREHLEIAEKKWWKFW